MWHRDRMSTADGSRRIKPGPRSFDPVALGHSECDAWATYYRHEWPRFLVASLAMVRGGFGMGWARTVLGAWHVLRANQLWAPYPDNDPVGAQASMRRFYTLVTNGELTLDPAEAARREVEWWRIHRYHQREESLSEDDLVDALCDLYSYVYSCSPEQVREAAWQRVIAMRLSDEWVDAGCDPASELLAAERRALVASYTALLDAVSVDN
jgi:hypothetical protein